MPGPIEIALKERLSAALSPLTLEITNNSAKHRGHLPSDEETGETHFSIRITAEGFTGKSRVERHRLVHQALGAQFEAGLHALSVKALAPGES